jgi:hypothetical protein
MNGDGEPDDQKGHVRFEVAGAGIRLALSAVGVRKPSSEMDRTERPLSETQALRQPSTLPEIARTKFPDCGPLTGVVQIVLEAQALRQR